MTPLQTPEPAPATAEDRYEALLRPMSPERVAELSRQASQGNHQPVKSAVIVGGGPGGLAAAIELLQKGIHVTVLEARSQDYQRPHHLNARQSTLDSFSDLGVYGAIQEASGWNIAAGDPHQPAPPRTGHSHGESRRVIGEPSVAQVRISDVEKALYQNAVDLGVEFLPHTESRLVEGKDGMYGVDVYPVKEEGGRFVPTGPSRSLPQPDLVIVADGAGSPTRRQLGIPVLEESEPKYYLGAEVNLPLGPEHRKLIVHNRTGEVRHLMATGHARYPQTWISVEADGRVKDMTADQRAEVMRRGAQQVMQRPVRLEDMGWGVGQFTVVQNRRAERTTAGNNVVLLGDAARTGSVWVSGGLNLALTADLKDVVKLVDEINLGQHSREHALKFYNLRTQAASKAWHEAGVRELSQDDAQPTEETLYRAPAVCAVLEDPPLPA